MLNLFIGVIMNSMQEAALETERAAEAKRRADPHESRPMMEQELFELERAAQALAERAAKLQRRTAKSDPGGAPEREAPASQRA